MVDVPGGCCGRLCSRAYPVFPWTCVWIAITSIYWVIASPRRMLIAPPAVEYKQMLQVLSKLKTKARVVRSHNTKNTTLSSIGRTEALSAITTSNNDTRQRKRICRARLDYCLSHYLAVHSRKRIFVSDWATQNPHGTVGRNSCSGSINSSIFSHYIIYSM